MGANAKKPAAKKAAAKKPAAKKPAAKKPPTLADSFFEHVAAFAVDAEAAGRTRTAPDVARSELTAAMLGIGYPHVLISPSEVAEAKAAKKGTVEKAAEDVLRYGGPRMVETLEAQYGAVPAATAIVDALVAAKVGDLQGGKYENYGWAVIYGLGWLLWRVPISQRETLRGKLRGVLEKLQAAGELWRTGQALDVILNGRAGVERSGRNFNGQLFLTEAVWADDDREWVRAFVLSRLKTLRPQDREPFDIQLAVVGGAPVLAALRNSLAKFPKDQRASAERQFSLCG